MGVGITIEAGVAIGIATVAGLGVSIATEAYGWSRYSYKALLGVSIATEAQVGGHYSPCPTGDSHYDHKEQYEGRYIH